MGGYLPGLKKDKSNMGVGEGGRIPRSSEKRKNRYKVVYTDRNIKISELPRDIRALFVLRRSGSMFLDEDGHLAHEFYHEKKIRNKKGVVRWIMERTSYTQLAPQGEVKHVYPRLHGNCPVVLLDSNAIIVPVTD